MTDAKFEQNLLKNTLDAIADARSKRYLANDPLSFCHLFNKHADQEVAALIASSFAYGAVGVILKSLHKIFSLIGDSPASYCDNLNSAKALNDFKDFKHRFNDGRDLCALLLAIKLMRQKNGSIENFYKQFYDPLAPSPATSLNKFCKSIKLFDYSSIFQQPEIPVDSYFPFLFPEPESGSACKRLCMFLRWMVRRSDGIDLGLWSSISPAQLLIPVDTHISRIARYLGLTNRKQADWKMAEEITAALRRLDPKDPVKYDFALAHLGISDGCNGVDAELCKSCGIATVCNKSKNG